MTAKKTGKRIRLGSATGWSRDRFEPATDLIERGQVHYLCFDSMSEVTMSAAQVSRMENDQSPPYDPYLIPRMEPILKRCKEQGIKIITNQGWLDPEAAAQQVAQLAKKLGINNLKIASVSGGILTQTIADLDVTFIEDGRRVTESRERIVSAEAYLGAQGIVEALNGGADVVITTRIADACLYLGPLAYEFDWAFDDYQLMAKGMVIGHLMECGSQLSGGYFADPGYKDVPDLANVGNPIAEVTDDRVLFSKLPDSGGVVSEATCKEQLLYEVGDPANYICPDCIVDFTKVRFKQVGENIVEAFADQAGKPRTPTLKALVGLTEGFMTEEMVIFAGPGALARAQGTHSLLEQRFKKVALKATEIRFDYLGINAVHRESSPRVSIEPYEVILRVAVKTAVRAEAEKIRREIDPLAVNGMSATGKWATSSPGSRVRPVVGLSSCLIPREWIATTVSFF